eukprot:CAMPEP_0197179908 /NCGR_PEP_ID=MMETSP1423-20130617/4706_1 /TAXON_ID=476441 /ORGANISM="Pseudo-nitzschia heimii, Strain UNC1101" /LENGTH=379 /DNA_ID=CAMNT_0042629897 /DNA_START=153 /DNA_END=1289 /DNA_ORIENTATION=+
MSEDGRESCGQCQLDYIDVGGGSSVCVKITEITWERFELDYNPFYTNIEHPARRLYILKESAQLISEGNALNQNATYRLGLTPFSADTEAEYQQRSGYVYVNVSGTIDELKSFNPPIVAAADIPLHVDWVAAGAVRSVKNQGRCGCSWAIGICGAIEGAAYLVLGSNQSMSFQQLISCNKRNNGCNGGSTTVGANYVAKSWFGGVTTLQDYPFIDANGLTSTVCGLALKKPLPAVEIKDPLDVVGLDKAMSFDKRVEIFKLALMEKPMVVIMKSSCKLFSNYVSGILTDDGDCDCTDSDCFDHSVLMVGFNDTDETPYFKFKNSWGTRWGEDGYFRVAQREKGAYGLFGIFGKGIMVEVKKNEDAYTKMEIKDTIFPNW